MTRRQYVPGDAIQMESETDPWIQYPDGTLVPLWPVISGLPTGACGNCHGGFFAPTNNGPTYEGIERCDECCIYDGDLDAALALAGVVGKGATVWFEEDEG